ncbi:MAG TPA: hypothetical protein DCO71_08415, partial [Gammaproteobacteria bacterium]|nr:hypothetical protein [Gammaproteobacteria bacterium]
MNSFTNSALRLLRSLLGAPSRSTGPYVGTITTLDGNTAVAVTEAGISETVALAASYPADAANLGWRCEQYRHGDNSQGAVLGSLAAESPRGALAAASGLSLSGSRAVCFLSGPDLASSLDLLTAAAGRHLPLVAHIANRALPNHSNSLGSGHEALHLAADCGCFVLFASNVQEAVDFYMVARHVAEQALIPGLVFMDGEQTALSMQELRLPPGELTKQFLGAADDEIPAATPAQRFLFGDTRRRIPRWHNPDRPAMLGGLQTTESWGLGRAAHQVFYQQHLVECLNQAFTKFEQLTGRNRRPLSTHRMEDAKLVLVVQGAAIETAETVADGLRRHYKCKVGVLGVRVLRPFPGAEIARLLGRNCRVCVLERLDSPAESDPPLLRELRSSLGRAMDNGRHG